MVGCEQRSRPLSGAWPEASLNRGSVRSASQSSASSHGTGFAGPRTGSAAGDREHTEAQHGGKGMDDLCLIAPIADAACQRVGQAQAALRLAQQDKPAVRRDQAAIEGGGHLLALDGWQMEGKKAIVGHGGCGALVVREERRVDNEFLPYSNELRHVCHLNTRPAGRVEDRRASFRVRWFVRRFRSGPQSGSHGRVSSPRSSNRTCGFPASGFRTRSCLRVRKAHGPWRQASEAVVIA